MFLVNHLGVNLGNDPEKILKRLDRETSPKPTSSTGLITSHRTTSMRSMCARSMPIVQAASMPIRDVCSRPRGAPAN